MKTLIAAREEVVRELKRAVVYGRCVIVRSAQDAIDLRHEVHKAQPDLVLLDDDFSGEFDVLEAVDGMRGVRSLPAPVLLTDDLGSDVEARAVEAGCLAVVRRHRQWKRVLAGALAKALAARRLLQRYDASVRVVSSSAA